MSAKIIVRGRIEEVIPMGGFTLTSYDRDIAQFQGYKPAKYTAAFRTNLVAKGVLVQGIIYPIILINEEKVITLRMMNNVLSLHGTMDLLEGYVEDAIGLSVAGKDFGIGAVRKCVNSGNVEGLDLALQNILSTIASGTNMAKLTTAGYTPAARAALIAMRTSISDDNTAQNAKETQRGSLVVANMHVINDYLKDVKAIWIDGKHIFKSTDKIKLKDYTNSQLIARMRNDELHTWIQGDVFNKTGGKEKGAKIVCRPVSVGKRGKTVTSDPEGAYVVKGLKPVDFIFTIKLKNGNMFAVAGTAVTNVHVTLNIHQPV